MKRTIPTFIAMMLALPAALDAADTPRALAKTTTEEIYDYASKPAQPVKARSSSNSRI